MSVQNGKEEQKPYSILHLRDTSYFKCESVRNDFDVITSIECQIPQASQHPFPTIQNTHFTVDYKPSSTGYSIVISPKTKIALFADSFDLLREPQTYRSSARKTKEWSIIGYSDSIPMLPEVKENQNALNLPIRSAKETYPYVGGLDLKGNPIKMKRIEDVNDYMEIKKHIQVKIIQKHYRWQKAR